MLQVQQKSHSALHLPTWERSTCGSTGPLIHYSSKSHKPSKIHKSHQQYTNLIHNPKPNQNPPKMSSTNYKFHAIHNVSCLICLIWKPVWLCDFYWSWSTFRTCELVFTYTVWAGARLHGLRLWRQGGLLFQVILLLLAWYFLSNIPDSQGKLLFEFWQQLFNIGASSLHEILSMGIGIDSCVINKKHPSKNI